MAYQFKFTDKGFLREHPLMLPIIGALTSPPFIEQHHSYIFPGDELALYHRISLPENIDDVAASINQINLISAKISLIAEKKQIYSEQYSEVYKSTRSFTLDEFIIQFNSRNAPRILWGSDGYAPYVNYIKDRDFRLPSGELDRQLKIFTTHTPHTSQWQYWFYFPILFRWEYWISLLGASNDFFDTSQVQNGLNQFWFHYFSTKWKIVSRLDLNITVNGIPTSIRSDLNLTPNSSGDVRNYNSNSDWENKSILTSVIAGTPSTPCFVKNNEATEVFAYFEKVSDWSPSEQTNISGLVWIEPFEGTGISARTRASSKRSIHSESVFMGTSLALVDDSGIGIQTDGSNYIVISANGVGVQIYFDGINPKKVTFFALIDHLKVAAIYPGITKFTLYARLYNSTLVSSETTPGEEINEIAVLISLPQTSNLCSPIDKGCPFEMDVYATSSGNDETQNDKSDFYEFGDPYIDQINFTLEKNNSTCGGDDWVDKVEILNSAYGNFFGFGQSPDFLGSTFSDELGKRYTGLLLEWKKVLAAFGIGNYRMRIDKYDLNGTLYTYHDNRIFCLKEYHCNLIEGSVRIEVLNQGSRGTLNDSEVFIDYSTGWKSQIRVPALMEYKKSGYTKEYTQYGESDRNALKPYIDEQHAKFLLSVKPVPGWMHYYLSTNVLQADQIWITDYNKNNQHTFLRTPVINDGDYEPADVKLGNPLSSVDISLAYGQNNLRRRNSG